LYSGDAGEVFGDEDIRPGTINVRTFAHPLEVVTNSETLKKIIVQRLLEVLPE
jgi:hypothetical protein